MSIDLSQFHQVFFEESFEGLDIMESALMELDPDDIDSETINAIFRSAHSIKGGSATFGFTAVAEFTHILETLLDEVRSGKRSISPDEINLFLQSVDCMKEMLELLQAGDDAQTELSEELQVKFTEILAGKSSNTSAKSSQETLQKHNSEAVDVVVSEEKWIIEFNPDQNILKTGNDPSRIIRELKELGELTCITHLEKLIPLSELHSDECYLSWHLELISDVEKSVIEEVFEWVADESDIVIRREANASEATSNKNNVNPSKWSIKFEPNQDVLKTGNDPIKIFNSLSEIGNIECKTSFDLLPKISQLESEQCYLRWEIEMDGENITEGKITEAFEWVADESKLVINPPSEVESKVEVDDSNHSNESIADTKNDESVVVNHPKLEEKKSERKTTAQAKVKTKKASTETSSIRVGTDKVDSLIDMVGELVITQSMLGQLGTDFETDRIPKLIEGLNQLEQNTRELQESVMRIRMLPISFAFSRFPRMVRDLSQSLGKEIELEMLGEQTELDKTVMEKIGDPLVHLVRNAVDHGIELPDERAESNKDRAGRITLNAFHQSGNVVIEIEDDGKGLNPEKLKEKAISKGIISVADAEQLSKEQAYDLIFQPGFSTAKEVTDVSGRGVGMDVVKRNIQALNGSVEINSELGRGSKITIRLPLTLAILDGQLVRVGSNTYVFPLISIVESMQCKSEYVSKVADGCEVFKLRDDYVPIINLSTAFSVASDSESLDNSLMVVVESEGDKVGVIVDELLAQQQVVIKSLEQNYRKVEGISGATILGNGTVALILDIPGIVRLAGNKFKVTQNKINSALAMELQGIVNA